METRLYCTVFDSSQVILILVGSDGFIGFGSENQSVKAGEMKTQYIIKYTFCGDGGRQCPDENMQQTVGKVLKVCFEGKVSE